MKRLFLMLQIAALSLFVACGDDNEGNGGSGEPQGPSIELIEGVYHIYNAKGLREFAEIINTATEVVRTDGFLVNDIDLGGEEWTPIGSVTASYLGHFDGNNKKITGLKITRSTTEAGENNENSYCGLFGESYFVRVTNIKRSDFHIKNLTIVEPYITGYENVGGIIGHLYNSGERSTNATIENCHVIGGSISGFESVGGIAGSPGLANIYVCTNNNTSIEGVEMVGGIAGYSADGTNLSGCYNTAKITGNTSVGGIFGYGHNSYIRVSFNTGEIYGQSQVGGLKGRRDGGSINTNTGPTCWIDQPNDNAEFAIGFDGNHDFDQPSDEYVDKVETIAQLNEQLDGVVIETSANINTGWEFVAGKDDNTLPTFIYVGDQAE